MSKRIPQSKRLQLINKWLRGIEDDDYEVFPTKTDGKYIVRPRKKKEHIEESDEDTNIKSDEDPIEEKIEEQIEEPKTQPKQKIKVKSQMNQTYDPTINIEILNQLKLLGEEIKAKRKKKEQKRIIKEVIQKQINKHPSHYLTSQNNTVESVSNIEDEAINDEPNPKQQEQSFYQPRRRNNIFSDLM